MPLGLNWPSLAFMNNPSEWFGKASALMDQTLQQMRETQRHN